jgi:uncharacterized membrane protein YfcA
MPATFDAKVILLGALAVVTIFYIVVLARAAGRARARSSEPASPTGLGLGTGFVTNFFDTLGIGSFATTTSIFRFLKMVPDERIPGTLNVGHTLPTIAQAFIFTTAVPVESTTLISMIAAAVLGAWLGAGVVCKWPRRRIQMGMGLCLLAAAVLLAAKAMGRMPDGASNVTGVTGGRLAIAVGGNFVLGALMTLGIGLYAPCMILVSLVGMNVTAAFPIMMGSCAFLMPFASARFVREGRFDLRTSLGLALGGIPAALIAGLIIKSLPLTAVMWLVVVVVIYTAFTLLRSARSTQIAKEATAAEATGAGATA